jgi:alpha-galactosidase
MAPEVRAILTDPEVIAIDQDPSGRAGDRVLRVGDIDIWARPLADGGKAVALLNRGRTPVAISVDPLTLGLAGLAYCVRDVTVHADAGVFGSRLTRQVAPHAVAVLRLAPSRLPCPAAGT